LLRGTPTSFAASILNFSRAAFASGTRVRLPFLAMVFYYSFLRQRYFNVIFYISARLNLLGIRQLCVKLEIRFVLSPVCVLLRAADH
jgi:hypothetical protein